MQINFGMARCWRYCPRLSRLRPMIAEAARSCGLGILLFTWKDRQILTRLPLSHPVVLFFFYLCRLLLFDYYFLLFFLGVTTEYALGCLLFVQQRLRLYLPNYWIGKVVWSQRPFEGKSKFIFLSLRPNVTSCSRAVLRGAPTLGKEEIKSRWNRRMIGCPPEGPFVASILLFCHFSGVLWDAYVFLASQPPTHVYFSLVKNSFVNMWQSSCAEEVLSVLFNWVKWVRKAPSRCRLVNTKHSFR